MIHTLFIHDEVARRAPAVGRMQPFECPACAGEGDRPGRCPKCGGVRLPSMLGMHRASLDVLSRHAAEIGPQRRGERTSGTARVRVPVRCVETGAEYPSAYVAARAIGGLPGRQAGNMISGITDAAKRGTRAYGFHWRLI